MRAFVPASPQEVSGAGDGAIPDMTVVVNGGLQLRITIGRAALIVLAIVSFLLRLAELDSVPMTAPEVRPALSAYRAVTPDVPGSAIDAHSPIVFWAQRTAFTLLGAGEFSARIFTALAGVALGLSPLLFGPLLGWMRAAVLTALLTFSPVLLAASRSSSGAVWAMLIAVGALWLVWQYAERGTQNPAARPYAIAAMAAFGAMLLLSDFGGPLLGFMLLAAATYSLIALDNPEQDGAPESGWLAGIRERLAQWPWGYGGIAAAVTIVVVSTGFMSDPSGLSSVGGLVERFFNGFTHSQPGAPIMLPLLNSLFYEPWLWLFAGISLWSFYQRGMADFVERFLVAWLLLGVFISVVYVGASADHALWLTLPLAGLASYSAAALFENEPSPVMWLDDLLDDDEVLASSSRWGKWLITAGMVALLVMVSIHFQIVARGILSVPEGSLVELANRLSISSFARVANSLVWLLLSILFIVVGFFLAASVWGNVTTARGMAAGGLLFGLVTSAAAGWNASVTRAHDPVEPWHIEATARDAGMLWRTLTEFSQRETAGEPLLSIAVLADDSGILAWYLREFKNVTYIHRIEQARGFEFVILPELAPMPDLGAAYVGQRFVLTRRWLAGRSLRGFDVLAWWSVRRVRFTPIPAETVVLWVRQDVYNGTAGR